MKNNLSKTKLREKSPPNYSTHPSPHEKETIVKLDEEEMETQISETGESSQHLLMPPQMLLKSMLVSALKTTFEIRTPSRA